MEDNLGSLVTQIARLLRRSFEEQGRIVGLTRPQWQLLALLANDQGLHQGAIAERLEVEPVSVGRMLDRMQDADLIERRPDPADRRAWRVFLTEKGLSLLEQLRPFALATLERALDGVNDKERDQLMEVLARVRTNLLCLQTAEADRGEKRQAHG